MSLARRPFEEVFRRLVVYRKGPVSLGNDSSNSEHDFFFTDCYTQWCTYSLPFDPEDQFSVGRAAKELVDYLVSAFCDYKGIKVSNVKVVLSTTGIYKRPSSITVIDSLVYDEDEDSRPMPPNLAGKPYIGPYKLYDVSFSVVI